MTSKSNFKNVAILMCCQGLLLCGISMTSLIGSLIGYDIAPSPSMSTLPITSIILGNALNIIPAIWIISKLGRKKGTYIGMSLTALSALLAMAGLYYHSFSIYLFSQFVFGLSLSFVQQFRFAAAESVQKEDIPKAVSWILVGGIFAAFVGPQLGVTAKSIFPSVLYMGSYGMFLLLIIFSAVIFTLFTPIKTTNKKSETPNRPLGEILAQPKTKLAILTATLSYSVMTFIMVSTPISMHKIHLFSLPATKLVIQSHIMAMFIPSLFTGLLIQKLGLFRLLNLGLFIYLLCTVTGLFPISYTMYLIELILLGIGWNFIFVSATTLLTTTYQEGEGFKVQAINDVFVFGSQVIVSLLVGVLILDVSWAVLNGICMALLCLFFGLYYKYKTSSNR
jgi:MFS family permease